MTPRANRPKPLVRAEFGEDQVKRLWSMFGTMIGAENAVKQMGEFILDPATLPREKNGGETIEARFLRIFYVLTGDNDPTLRDEQCKPVIITRDDMVHGLALEVGEEKAAEFVDKVINRRPMDGNIHRQARGFADWIASRRGAMACIEAQEVFDGRIGTVDEQWLEAMRIIESAAPRPKASDDIQGGDGFDMWEKAYLRRVELAKQGRTAGPRLPWGLTRKVAMLKKNDLCTFAGKSSMGKSTVALLLAHNIAHEQKGYDVLYLYMETRTESQFDRLVSSGIDITVQDLQDPGDEKDDKGKVIKKGYNLFEDPKGLAAYRNFVANYRRKELENGRVWFSHCPGITGIEVRAKIAMYKALAEAKGRELVVLVDYYSLLSPVGLIASDAPGWAQNDAKADFFKETAEQYEVYMITFAQDNMEADYTDHARKTTKNGSLIYERSQVLIRIMRDWAESSLPFVEQDGKNKGEQKLDLAGRPMWWHEESQPTSLAKLAVEKASDGAVGPVEVKILGAYFRIYGQTWRKRD